MAPVATPLTGHENRVEATRAVTGVAPDEARRLREQPSFTLDPSGLAPRSPPTHDPRFLSRGPPAAPSPGAVMLGTPSRAQPQAGFGPPPA